MTNVCCCEEQNQSEELRVYDWALLDNTDKIPKDKLPNDVYTKDEINTIIGPIGPISVKSYVDERIATIDPQAPIEFPEITIIDGYWYINGLKAAKVTGDQGTQGPQGDKGDQGEQGPQGNAGKSAYEIAKDNGFNGTEALWLESLTPKISIDSEGYWCINGENTGVKAKGEKGSSGADGESGTTIEVINDHWVINGRDYGPIRGAEGRGIRSISKTGLEDDWTDIYTITYTDNSFDTFKVINGKDGEKGDKGDNGLDGLNGRDGVDGADGKNGEKTYFHVAYANKNSLGDIINFSTTDPTEREYIGTYVDDKLPDSNNPLDYTWMLVRGAQGADGTNGIPGTNGKDGADGQTQYLHIKYSNDGGRTFTDNNGETPGYYLGQYVDFNEHDELNVSYYKWSLIKGEPGKDGKDGVGINIKGSVNLESELPQSGNEAGDAYFVGEYIFVWNGTTWKNMGRIAGEGSGGSGKTLYLHIAYANSDDGSVDFSVIDDKSSGIIHNYLGICINDEVEDPGEDRCDEYTWTLIRGAQGNPGADGTTFEFIYTRNDGKTSGDPNPPNAPIKDENNNSVKNQDDWHGKDSAGITWTDNPQGVEKYKKYEYVSTRAKKNGIWSDFSTPVVWSSWGKDGLDGDGFEYIYTVTTESLGNPTSPTPSNWRDSSSVYQTVNEFVNYIPLQLENYSWTWTDDPQQLTSTNKYQWVSVRKRTNGVWDLFSTPVIWSKWSEKGSDGGHWEKRYKLVDSGSGAPDKPTGDGTDNGWVRPGVIETIDNGKVMYESECFVDGEGNYGEWSNPLRITGGNESSTPDIYLSFDRTSKITNKTFTFEYNSNTLLTFELFYNGTKLGDDDIVTIENSRTTENGLKVGQFTTITHNNGIWSVKVDKNEGYLERTENISIIYEGKQCMLYVKLECKPLPVITINVSGPGYVSYEKYTIRNNEEKKYSVEYGKNVTLAFNPNLNCRIKSFTVTENGSIEYRTDLILDSKYTFSLFENDITVNVVFEEVQDDMYRLTVMASGEGEVFYGITSNQGVKNSFKQTYFNKYSDDPEDPYYVSEAKRIHVTMTIPEKEEEEKYKVTVKLDNYDITEYVIYNEEQWNYTLPSFTENHILRITFEKIININDTFILNIRSNGNGTVKYEEENCMITSNLLSFRVLRNKRFTLRFIHTTEYRVASLKINGINTENILDTYTNIVTDKNVNVFLVDVTFDVLLIEEVGLFTWENGETTKQMTFNADDGNKYEYFYYNGEVRDLGKNNIITNIISNFFDPVTNTYKDFFNIDLVGNHCTITPYANPSTNSRTGTITFTYKNQTITLNITQLGSTNSDLEFRPPEDIDTVSFSTDFNILGLGRTGYIQKTISENVANRLKMSLIEENSGETVILLESNVMEKSSNGYYISRSWDSNIGLTVDVSLTVYQEAINTYNNLEYVNFDNFDYNVDEDTYKSIKLYPSYSILDAAKTIGMKTYILRITDPNNNATGNYRLYQVPDHWIKDGNLVCNFGLSGCYVMGKSLTRVNKKTDNISGDETGGAIYYGVKDNGYCSLALNNGKMVDMPERLNGIELKDSFYYNIDGKDNEGKGEFWLIMLDDISGNNINIIVSNRLGDLTDLDAVKDTFIPKYNDTIKLLKRRAVTGDEVVQGKDFENNVYDYVKLGSYSFRYLTDRDWRDNPPQ